MSLARFIRNQIGLSNTQANNFTLDASADNGTMKLARGNAGATTQDILTVDASGVVDHPQGVKIAGAAGQRMLLTAAQATTAGTAIDFTGIPSWAKKITVMFDEVSLSGTDEVIIQLGTSSGFVVSGYVGAGISTLTTGTGATGNAIGFRLSHGGSFATAARVRSGEMILNLTNTNRWVCFGAVTDTAGAGAFSSGAVSTGGVVDRLRLTTATSANAAGTNTFDAGSVSLLIEGY